MSQVFQFDLGDVIVTWGSFIIDGPGDGNFIAIKYDNPLVTEHEGGLGDVTILLNKSKKGTATLSSARRRRTTTRSAPPSWRSETAARLVKHRSPSRTSKGISKAFARTAYVREAPELAFGMQHNNRRVGARPRRPRARHRRERR
jgi:hypothetical protein